MRKSDGRQRSWSIHFNLSTNSSVYYYLLVVLSEYQEFIKGKRDPLLFSLGRKMKTG